MRRLASAALMSALCLAACAPRERPNPRDVAQGLGDPAARAAAIAWLSTARFEQADPATDCEPDCRMQERGFDFARARDVEQPGDCDLARVRAGANEDFIEGCRAYGQYIEAAGRRP
jgi:hypothetical protein